MSINRHLSTTELAKMLGISRVAVFYKIKKGGIPAIKVGRNYVISGSDLPYLPGSRLGTRDKRDIAGIVRRATKQYRKTLELLGRE